MSQEHGNCVLRESLPLSSTEAEKVQLGRVTVGKHALSILAGLYRG